MKRSGHKKAVLGGGGNGVSEAIQTSDKIPLIRDGLRRGKELILP